MKKILIINGHPNPESFNQAMIDSFLSGITSPNTEVKILNIHELDFEPNLKYGFTKRMEVEADILKAQELILWCDFMVWFHPVWWGGLPALTKGFIDRTFTPGFAFKYRENSPWWDKLLAGKKARIITTLDTPPWFYYLLFNRPSVNQLKKTTLEFCGVKPVKVSYFGPLRNSTTASRQKMLDGAKALGEKDVI
ncbi:MAG: flavodoxin family protein [Flavobacteriales bacterium]|nr:flavodoxin family protein [Flavobacteriales bacterium]